MRSTEKRSPFPERSWQLMVGLWGKAKGFGIYDKYREDPLKALKTDDFLKK